MRRAYYLSDGTLQVVAGGGFRDIEESEHAVITRTREVIVHDVDQHPSHGIELDPSDPVAPLKINFDDSAFIIRARDLNVADPNPAGTPGAFSVSRLGVLTTAEVNCDQLGGNAVDMGEWVHTNATVPTETTVVARNATTESVSVANLRVGDRTDTPHGVDGQPLLDGPHAPDDLPRGLYFTRGAASGPLELLKVPGDASTGKILFAANNGDHFYQVGHDDLDDADTGLFFEDEGAAEPRKLVLCLNNTNAMVQVRNTNSCYALLGQGTSGLQTRGDVVMKDRSDLTRLSLVDDTFTVDLSASHGVTALEVDKGDVECKASDGTIAFAVRDLGTGHQAGTGSRIEAQNVQCGNMLMTSNDDRFGGCRELGLVAKTLTDPSATYNVLSIHDQTAQLVTKIGSKGSIVTNATAGVGGSITCRSLDVTRVDGFGGSIACRGLTTTFDSSLDYIMARGLRLKGGGVSRIDGNCLAVVDQGDSSVLWAVDVKGHMHGSDVTDMIHGGSVATGDKSVYIGSSRFSYDRTSHVVTLHTLKTSHIPAYLTAAGVTTQDLTDPINDMTIRDWVIFARAHLSQVLGIGDVFPATNTGDWNVADAPVPTLQAWANGADADIATLETEMDAAEVRLTTLEAGGGGVTEPPLRLTVYCDSEYAGENGGSNGSFLRPYTSLLSAMFAKLTQGATNHYTFHLQPGVYQGATVVERSSPSQSFTIQGSGMDTTFIQAAASFGAAGANDNVLKLKHYHDVSIKDVTIRHGAYGAYIRNCRSVTLENIRFHLCGSDGTTNRHDFTATQAQQAAFWASNSTSNGGACRVRDCEQVHITGCHIDHCARGLRIQDCGSLDKASLIEGNRTSRTLESGIYLAAVSYDGASGCQNIKVTGNHVHDSMNNGILVIGGASNAVVGNTISGCDPALARR
jgi:hypothetical protein